MSRYQLATFVLRASIAVTASAAICPNAQYEFWILPPGGSWSLQRGYGVASWTWNTAGLATGTYQFGVWVKQGGSAAAYDAYFITTYHLGFSGCTSSTLNASPAGPQPAGTQMSVAAGVSGCPSPLYEFWLLPAGSSTWRVILAYGTFSSITWGTTGLAPGPYRMGVWTKQANSPNSYDAYSILTIWID